MTVPRVAAMVAAISLSVFTGCSSDPGTLAFPAARLGPPPVDYVGVTSHPNRPVQDRSSDFARQPAKALAFAGIQPDMAILEVDARAGYYTELLSRIVGEGGQVYMHNPEALDAGLENALAARLEDGRLPNVEMIRAPLDDYPLADDTVDLVTWFFGPDDLWLTDGSTSRGEPRAAFAEIARVLKPGGTFVAFSHSAPPNATETGVEVLPDSEVSHLLALADFAGLELVGEGGPFLSPDAPTDEAAFSDPSRGEADRILFKFEKR